MGLKLFACGDIVNYTAKENFVDENLRKLISDCDISICNFEAPIKIDSMKPIKKVGPHIYQSPESIKYVKNVGFNILSLANNHIYDFGQETLLSTIKEIKNQGIDFIGGGKNFQQTYQAKTISAKGIKIGLLACAENQFGCLYDNLNRGGYAWLFHDLIEDNIRALRKEVDIVVLIVHAGVENINAPIKEWRDRYKRLCNVGVDVVIGHHPHVPQGYEKYNNSMIFYSLGNFYFDFESHLEQSEDSYSIVLEFEKTGLKDFDIIYHKKINGKTNRVSKDDVNFYVKRLNKLLENDYEIRNDKICIELFNNYYYDYYKSALGIIPRNYNLKQKIKLLVKKLLFAKKYANDRNLLLLHNIKIESHRFVVQRALSLISETTFSPSE